MKNILYADYKAKNNNVNIVKTLLLYNIYISM